MSSEAGLLRSEEREGLLAALDYLGRLAPFGAARLLRKLRVLSRAPHKDVQVPPSAGMRVSGRLRAARVEPKGPHQTAR